MRNFVQRFWGKIKVDINSDCWNWCGNKDKDGYGKIYYLGSHHRTHRVSYSIYKGKIPTDMCVLHRCDNPSCVNPNHLFIGTPADNNQDRAKKHRSRNQNGVLNNRVKLSVDNVIYILEHKEKKQQELASQFGISQIQVSRIRRGLRWSGGLI